MSTRRGEELAWQLLRSGAMAAAAKELAQGLEYAEMRLRAGQAYDYVRELAAAGGASEGLCAAVPA